MSREAPDKKSKAEIISRALTLVTSLLLTFIIFYGSSVVKNDNAQDAKLQDHEVRIVRREENAYTQDEANADLKALDERLRFVENTQTGIKTTLESIHSQLVLMRQDIRDIKNQGQ